ncbi:MAG TPA: DMT family transporter [Acetobacteraceae bacterium]|nr:DMT family transporter [Acetobacteraceae bacterium]
MSANQPIALRRPTFDIWSSAWTLLVLTNLFWAGNIVLGRGVAGLVPPIALSYVRWTGAFLIGLAFAWRQLQRDLPVLMRHWPLMLLLSATGVASYNTMSYIGLTETTALNVLLLQSAMPLVILVWAFVLFRDRPSVLQTIGVAVSLLGVVTIAGQGSIEVLRHLSINHGDLWVLGAIAINGSYAAMLRLRPRVHPLSFLVAAMGIGSCMNLPFFLWEEVTVAHIPFDWHAIAALGYIAVFPSFIAYLFFNRGIELIGAGRAGQSMHLMPVFGAVLAVLFLGEQFHVYHAVGIALIASGIVLASLRGPRRAAVS